MPITFHIIIGISINVCKLRLSCVNLVSNGHGVFRDVITVANPGYVVGLQSMVSYCIAGCFGCDPRCRETQNMNLNLSVEKEPVFRLKIIPTAQ